MCTPLADVASSEQQQSAKDSGKDKEEEETEDALMDMEEQEELRTADTEQLKPEEVKSGVTATSGEFCLVTRPLLSLLT
jgi:midasin